MLILYAAMFLNTFINSSRVCVCVCVCVCVFILWDFLHIRLCHLQIEIVLVLPFQLDALFAF